MTDTADVVVVGAGVVGAAIAYELAHRGMRVSLIEREAIGSGASAHATGFLSILGTEFTPGPSFAMGVEAYHDFIDLIPRLQEDSGMDVLYQRRPALRLALGDDEAGLIITAMDWQRDLVSVEWLDPSAVHRIEPRLSDAIVGAAYEPESAQLDSYRLNLALAAGAEKHGTEVLTRVVTGLRRSGNRVTGVDFETGGVDCDWVVLAMGPWSDACADWLGFPVPVRPMKGERLLLRYAGDPLPCLISSPKRGHMISRLDGYLSVGSTGGRDYDDREAFAGIEFDRQPTEAAQVELIQRALDVFPGLEEAEVVQQLAGSRPLSADRNPIVGPVPGLDGVLLATGHSTKGIHLAPITGRMIAEHVTGEPAGLLFDPSPFLPARFAGMADPDYHAAGEMVDE